MLDTFWAWSIEIVQQVVERGYFSICGLIGYCATITTIMFHSFHNSSRYENEHRCIRHRGSNQNQDCGIYYAIALLDGHCIMQLEGEHHDLKSYHGFTRRKDVGVIQSDGKTFRCCLERLFEPISKNSWIKNARF